MPELETALRIFQVRTPFGIKTLETDRPASDRLPYFLASLGFRRALPEGVKVLQTYGPEVPAAAGEPLDLTANVQTMLGGGLAAFPYVAAAAPVTVDQKAKDKAKKLKPYKPTKIGAASTPAAPTPESAPPAPAPAPPPKPAIVELPAPKREPEPQVEKPAKKIPKPKPEPKPEPVKVEPAPAPPVAPQPAPAPVVPTAPKPKAPSKAEDAFAKLMALMGEKR